MEMDAYVQGGITIGIWLLVIVIAAGIVGAAIYFIRKWYLYTEYDCIIFYKDGFGQMSYKKDSAGVFVDKKTNNKRFFLKKSNVGLDPNNIPILPGSKKTVLLAQYGLKNFSYVKINMDLTSIKFTVGEEDVNWAVNAIEREDKKWRLKDTLLQYMPYISLAIAFIIILIMFIYLFKALPGMLTEMKMIVIESQKLQAMNQGTTILPGG